LKKARLIALATARFPHLSCSNHPHLPCARSLREAAINAGIETQFSPTEAIQGLTSLATAGQTAAQATRTLIPVLDLAAGSLGQLGVASAAEAVVGTLNAYGMTADQAAGVTDRLLRITQLTNFQTRDFEAGLAKAAATGAVFNQGLNRPMTSGASCELAIATRFCDKGRLSSFVLRLPNSMFHHITRKPSAACKVVIWRLVRAFWGRAQRRFGLAACFVGARGTVHSTLFCTAGSWPTVGTDGGAMVAMLVAASAITPSLATPLTSEPSPRFDFGLRTFALSRPPDPFRWSASAGDAVAVDSASVSIRIRMLQTSSSDRVFAGGIFKDLIARGILAADGDYGDDVVAQLVWLSDGMPWFKDHILLLLSDVVVILDVYHLLQAFAALGALCLPPKAKQALGRAQAPSHRRASPRSQALEQCTSRCREHGIRTGPDRFPAMGVSRSGQRLRITRHG
jgi:hypothetical protein